MKFGLMYETQSPLVNGEVDEKTLIENTIDRNLNGAFYMMNRAIGFINGDLGAPANQVTGIIIDSNSGAIIENAQVRILELDGGMLKPRLTDEFGRYRRLLSNGTYTIEVIAEGYHPQIETATSSSGSITTKNFQLVAKSVHEFELNLNLPYDHQASVFAEFGSDLNLYTFQLIEGLNTIQLYADKVLTVDVHSYQTQMLYKRFDSLPSFRTVTEYLTEKHSEILTNNLVIASPDAGGGTRAVGFGRRLGDKNVAIGHKLRKDGEADKVKMVREYLTSNIDWPCQIKTLFQEKNLG